VVRRRAVRHPDRELNEWHRNPPLRGPVRPLRDVGRFLESAERRAAKRLARARRHDFDSEFSRRARKAVKRARYVAELAEPVLGKQARRTKKHAKRMQQRLGAVQDSAIVLDFLRRAAIRTGDEPGENGFSFGFLSAVEMSRSLPTGDH
jgi:CHAD domain-containing protein